MTQLDFIPLRILEYKPNSVQRTIHQTGTAQCDDGLRYYVKGLGDDSDVCATEWICSSFARSLNLPVPVSKVLQTPQGTLVFGSQALPHCMPDLEASMLLMGGPGNMNVPDLQNILSAAYALDQLIGNPDRHDQNFLFQKTGVIDGQDVANVHLIDFGNSTLLSNGTPTALAEGSHTVQYGRKFRKAHGFSQEFAILLIDRFKMGRAFIWESALMGLPTEWLSKNERTSFISRIMSPEFEKRLDDLGNGMISGAYL